MCAASKRHNLTVLANQQRMPTTTLHARIQINVGTYRQRKIRMFVKSALSVAVCAPHPNLPVLQNNAIVVVANGNFHYWTFCHRQPVDATRRSNVEFVVYTETQRAKRIFTKRPHSSISRQYQRVLTSNRDFDRVRDASELPWALDSSMFLISQSPFVNIAIVTHRQAIALTACNMRNGSVTYIDKLRHGQLSGFIQLRSQQCRLRFSTKQVELRLGHHKFELWWFIKFDGDRRFLRRLKFFCHQNSHPSNRNNL
mmetsp:Transcript_44026/g.72763  ORF Transcript_44026/g.72763 Transcript_44026/m.72763 type:complete len:255 (-) Transcript_44026:995-1759(-)